MKTRLPLKFAVLGALLIASALLSLYAGRGHAPSTELWARFLQMRMHRSAVAWTLSAWKAAKPFVSGAAYQNYIDPRLDGWEKAYYGANYPRLQDAKKRYDPDFRFRFAQAIRPA